LLLGKPRKLIFDFIYCGFGIGVDVMKAGGLEPP
jgi:hypothetical protein